MQGRFREPGGQFGTDPVEIAEVRIRVVATATKPGFVDVGNPAMAIDCPKCGLVTARFNTYCRNCGFSLWPNERASSAAFEAWRGAEPGRRLARPFDLELPEAVEPHLVDYEERAHRLGIHLFPSSNFPFVICVGFFFLALAAVPFPAPARIALGVIGLMVFLFGVAGWVVLEDVRMFPTDDLMTTPAHGESPDGHGREEGKSH
jgi:hypothetical protein